MDFSDRKAWDDSELIDSWNEALAEYKKYHSIHAEGKRLEDVLTKEEMEQIHEQRRSLNTQKNPVKARKNFEAVEDNETEHLSPDRDILLDVNGWDHQTEGGNTERPGKPATNETASTANVQSTVLGPSSSIMPPLPPMIDQDESLKNLLMSWYYAGYYAGHHEGRQLALKELNTSSKT